MSQRQHSGACVITGVDPAPLPMPESLLLRRLSFTFLSAVETLTNVILACESHIPSSPHSPRPSRKRSLPMPPDSPTSVTGHVRSPISILDVSDDHPLSLFEEKSTSRRLRPSRSQHSNSAGSAHPKRRLKSSSRTHKLSRHPSSLPRRNNHHKNADTQPQVRPRYEKRLRTSTRRTQETRKSSNERLAFVQPASSKLSGMNAVNAWRRHRDTMQRATASRSHKRLRPEPPVAPIALPPTIQQIPRGTLTSLVTSDSTSVSLGLPKEDNSIDVNGKLLEQGIRPSRRVRFAQTVQLVY